MNPTHLDPTSAPIYECCLEFIQHRYAPFYCPGHKGGRTLEPKFAASMASFDLSNLPSTDTLHCPTGAILRGECLLAKAYGVDKSFILVGGSTLGNLTSLLATVKPGEAILAQRNSHKSIIAGIIQAGVKPIWLYPHYDADFGIAHGISAAQLQEALQLHPDVRAICLLHPTYYGTVADLRALAEISRRHRKILLVDEAHGSHFHFHNDLPIAAEDVGADMIVQSTHKTLSALSQGSVLHLNSRQINEGSVRKVLQLLQTTSPNYAIMSSIDLARRQMVLQGHERLSKTLALSRRAREELSLLPGLKLLSNEATRGEGSGFFHLDETKLLIDTSGLGLSGYEALTFLIHHGIQPELAGPTYVLCIFSIGTSDEDIDKLLSAMRMMVATRDLKELKAPRYSNLPPEIEMIPRDAFYAPSLRLPFKNCLGHTCAEVITPYPPGIPILMPGEKISKEILEWLETIKRANNPISASDPYLESIEVVK